MSSVSSVGGGGASGVQVSAEYAAKVAVMQNDAVKQQGELALELIQAASVGGGQSLDVKV